MLDNRRL